MSENESQLERKGDRWVDVVAAVALLAIALGTAMYWISSQGV